MAFPHPGKYYSVTLNGSQIVVNFNSIQIYETYEDIILQNYQFVRVNKDDDETIEYEFKFRREEVHITLKNCALYKTMKVDGNGRNAWWNEASHTLDKQFERLQSRDQEQGADTGENKKPLVSEEEFYNCFAIPNVYGTHYLPWPRSTILLYKYSSNATTKYWEIPEDTWKRIDNILYGQHAESIMIYDLKNIQDYLTIQPDDNEGSYKAILSVEVILSYSPCDSCSYALFHEKEKLDIKLKKRKTGNKDLAVLKKLSALSLTQEVDEEDEDEENIEFKITFSNFYKHTDEKYGEENMDGLKKLLRKGIKLGIFTDENWHYFFNAAGIELETDPERQRRERDDKKILQYLKGLVDLEKMIEAENTTKGSVDIKRMAEALNKTKLDLQSKKLLL